MEVVACGREKNAFKAHLFSKRHTRAASAVAQEPPRPAHTHKSPQSSPSRHKKQKPCCHVKLKNLLP